MKDQYSVAELLKIADARLYPSITHASYLVLRRRRLIFSKWLEGIPGDRLAVLDVGGRYQPYRPLIQHRVQRYLALDIQRTPLVDVMGKGEELPFRADTFDLVFATQVFELFPEPRVVAAQIHRVLKPGGHLMLSVASMYPRVADEEHWRYLPAGLKFALGPFSKIEIVSEVTSIGGALRLNAAAISIFAKYEFVRQILHHTVVPVLNLVGLVLENAGLSTNDQVAGNYSALAQK
jgi:SAM-dependent methyltransferase